jgi:hypothetical protein
MAYRWPFIDYCSGSLLVLLTPQAKGVLALAAQQKPFPIP